MANVDIYTVDDGWLIEATSQSRATSARLHVRRNGKVRDLVGRDASSGQLEFAREILGRSPEDAAVAKAVKNLH